MPNISLLLNKLDPLIKQDISLRQVAGITYIDYEHIDLI